MKTPEAIKKGLECCMKASEEACDHCPYCKECINFNAGNLYRDASAYINHLEARVPKWISVKERLPTESDGTVLVCFPDVFPYNSKEHCVNAKHDQRVKTAKYSQFSNVWYIGDMAGISKVRPTHWMPLPSTEGLK